LRERATMLRYTYVSYLDVIHVNALITISHNNTSKCIS